MKPGIMLHLEDAATSRLLAATAWSARLCCRSCLLGLR